MVAHGLCSSGLFCLSNITYERSGRRSLLVNKGLIGLNSDKLNVTTYGSAKCKMVASIA